MLPVPMKSSANITTLTVIGGCLTRECPWFLHRRAAGGLNKFECELGARAAGTIRHSNKDDRLQARPPTMDAHEIVTIDGVVFDFRETAVGPLRPFSHRKLKRRVDIVGLRRRLQQPRREAWHIFIQ
jgi:hypothetical protein